MRIYPLHDLNADDFENLVTLICRKIFGEAVIPYAKGPDGGKDGSFNGKANCFPSEIKPWEGQTVIQAKHTVKSNASCADNDFKKILNSEVLPAIERLKKVKKIDNYILFTNRKIMGKSIEKIEDLLDDKTGIPNIIIGTEKIQQWLKAYPNVVRESKIQDLLKPLQFDESDLKEIILTIHKSIPSKDKIESIYEEISYLELDKKNQLNDLGKEYFDNAMKTNFSYFSFLKDFFGNPINAELKELYDDTVDELNAKITIQRDNYLCFETLIEELYDHVVTYNTDLSKKKRIVRLFLHYMYCNCDIGKK